MTIFYIDPTSGADQNGGNPIADGTSFTPAVGSKGLGVIYSNMATAYLAAGGSGHQFYCRRGYYHNRSGIAFFSSFLTKSNCVFGDYGAPSAFKPILDGFLYHSPTAAADALWTHSGNGVWYIELAGATGQARSFRTGVGTSEYSNTSRELGQYWNPAFSVTDLGKNNDGIKQSIWFPDTGSPYRITVYTGSTTQAPPSFYNGITIAQPGVTVSNGLVFRNGAANNICKNLEIRGTCVATLGSSILTSGGTSNLVFNGVDSIACSKACIVFNSEGAAGYIVRGASWTNGIIDSKATGPQSINSPVTDFQNDDPIKIADACEGILINTFKVYCGTVHTAINVSPDNSSAPTQFPSNIIISNGYIEFTSESNDGRALGIDNVKGCILQGLTFRNTSTKCQVGGQDTYIIGCDFGPLAYNSDASNQRFLLEITNFPAQIAPTNTVVINNVFRTQGNPISKSAIGINTYSTAVAGVGANAISICNNLAILDPQDGFIALAPYNAAAQAAKPINATQQITNNYVCRSDGSAGLASTANVSGTIQTDTYVNDQPLNGFLASSGNIGGTLDLATLNSDFVPKSGSPLIGAGTGLIARTTSGGLAFNLGTHMDRTGLSFKNPPTIGAYEKGFTRTLRS